MRVQQMFGRKAGRRMRRALPKTMDAIQTRVERMGSGMVERLQDVGSRIRSSAALSATTKAVRRGSERTAEWMRDHPKALPLIGLGGALATIMMMVRSRRSARRQPKFLKGALQMMGGAPQVKKGLGLAFGRFIKWALTPSKPHVFRAITVKW